MNQVGGGTCRSGLISFRGSLTQQRANYELESSRLFEDRSGRQVIRIDVGQIDSIELVIFIVRWHRLEHYLNALTFGNYLWLEGRVRGGRFRNWARQFGFYPTDFVQPETEQEIIDLVKNSQTVRFFGSGHSFNAGVVTDDTLVSLDKYAGLIDLDIAGKQATFKANTRA
jgi:hypothetical protein